jgi:hypothetical protein
MDRPRGGSRLAAPRRGSGDRRGACRHHPRGGRSARRPQGCGPKWQWWRRQASDGCAAASGAQMGLSRPVMGFGEPLMGFAGLVTICFIF